MLVRTLTESDMPHLQKLYRYLDADNIEIPLNEALQRWEMLKAIRTAIFSLLVKMRCLLRPAV